MSEWAATPPRRGRPRSEKARRAILAAAADLLLDHGMARVSMDVVADRAGVSKATIYRWWPSKERLALDALLEWAAAGGSPPDTGTLRGDLLALVRPWVREIRKRPFGRVIAGLVTEAQSNPDFAGIYRRHFVEQRREPMRAAFARAIDRGEAPADLDILPPRPVRPSRPAPGGWIRRGQASRSTSATPTAYAAGKQIPVELGATVREVDRELEIEAVTHADHRSA